MAAYFFVRVSYGVNYYPGQPEPSRCFPVRKVAPELSGNPGRAEWRHLEPVVGVQVVLSLDSVAGGQISSNNYAKRGEGARERRKGRGPAERCISFVGVSF